MIERGKESLVFRLCVIAWLFGWFFKYTFFGEYFTHHIFDFPVTAEQFPRFFLSNQIAFTAYHLPALCILGLFVRKRSVYIVMSSLLLLCTTILGVHINTYN